MQNTLPILAVICLLATTALGPANASSPIGNAGTAKVDKGAFSAELRMGYTLDDESFSNDERFRIRQHIDYGFTDKYAIRLVLEQEERQDGDFDYRSFTFENRFQIFERDTHGWDGGIRLIYIAGDENVSDELDVRLIANVPFQENWEFRQNTIIEHELGAGAADGILLELRNQVVRHFPLESDAFRRASFGIEMFNDFGNLRSSSNDSDQDHQIGPVAKLDLRNGVYFQAGYRVGLYEEAPDHLFKLFMGKKF